MTIELAPELEAGLRVRAAAEGMTLEDVISRAVDSYLRRTAAQSVRRVPLADRRREMAWAARPDPAYFGKWVVLDGATVVASGTDGKAVYEEALGMGIRSPFLIFASPNENEPFVGGWSG